VVRGHDAEYRNGQKGVSSPMAQSCTVVITYGNMFESTLALLASSTCTPCQPELAGCASRHHLLCSLDYHMHITHLGVKDKTPWV
jgi:hypothetical protein